MNDGSEKQIAWAQKIRAQRLRMLLNGVEAAEGKLQAAGMLEQHRAPMIAALKSAYQQTADEQSAKWWIDAGRTDPGILERIIKAFKKEAESAGIPINSVYAAESKLYNLLMEHVA